MFDILYDNTAIVFNLIKVKWKYHDQIYHIYSNIFSMEANFWSKENVLVPGVGCHPPTLQLKLFGVN